MPGLRARQLVVVAAARIRLAGIRRGSVGEVRRGRVVAGLDVVEVESAHRRVAENVLRVAGRSRAGVRGIRGGAGRVFRDRPRVVDEGLDPLRRDLRQIQLVVVRHDHEHRVSQVPPEKT